MAPLFRSSRRRSIAPSIRSNLQQSPSQALSWAQASPHILYAVETRWALMQPASNAHSSVHEIDVPGCPKKDTAGFAPSPQMQLTGQRNEDVPDIHFGSLLFVRSVIYIWREELYSLGGRSHSHSEKATQKEVRSFFGPVRLLIWSVRLFGAAATRRDGHKWG